jgi:integrase
MATRARANGEGSIFPYRNGYAAYVWVTKPDGKRTRKYVYGKTRETVYEKWGKLQQQARNGPIATRMQTVGNYVAYWLAEIIEPNLSPATWATYDYVARRYLIPGLGNKRLDRLQVRDVQIWLNQVGRTCQCCAQGKDGRKPPARRRCCAIGSCCRELPSATTIDHVRRVLRAMLSQAVSDGYATSNAAKSVRLPTIRTRKRKAWTSDEARRFLESARADGDRLYPAYVLVLVVGLRKGEVLGLGWEDIDLDAGTVAIDWQIQRVGKVRGIERRRTKTASSDATLPLPPICVAALRDQHKAQSATKAEAGSAWHDNGLIITTKFGTPIEPRNFLRFWDRRCEQADVRRITVHDARRTCGSLLADLDVHPRVAMQILRHANFKITMEIYTQVTDQQTRDALKRLGESLG